MIESQLKQKDFPHVKSKYRHELYEYFKSKIQSNPRLTRLLVSFQANKQSPFYGWFKYREGFSQFLVKYLVETLMPNPGVLLDPFAGAGAALFAANGMGWAAKGIEILPVGIYAMHARLAIERIDSKFLPTKVAEVLEVDFSEYYSEEFAFQHIPITAGAYPLNEERELIGYIAYCHTNIEDDLRIFFLYAAFCILEEISYTRKDGQYLRWDYRSGRAQVRTKFDKGRILSFREAIASKLWQMANDLCGKLAQPSLLETGITEEKPGRELIEISAGSCLDLLPEMESETIDFILTSPPYANRYDYTRTYALELVYLGCHDQQVKDLRQSMLSCTVENKNKRAKLRNIYSQLNRENDFRRIEEIFNQQSALQEILLLLEQSKMEGKLNNPNIARLVHNYFYEMTFVTHEFARILRRGGVIAMVNDNVRYAGEEIPVDLILSDIAEKFGLTVRVIWTIGRGKGNSSQQMGSHGRTELRKCIYVWEKRNV